MKAIQPIDIWINGSIQKGNFIDSVISFDNLKDSANFDWKILTSDIGYNVIAQGTLIMVEPDYSIWDSTSDINQAAYEWVCNQLSLTLIP